VAVILPAVVVALAVLVAERLAGLDLTQVFLAQLLCMAVVEPEQIQVQEPHLQVEEVMTIHQQQTEAVVDRSQQQIVGLLLQVQRVL
jgi:hypothetical protein